MTSGAPFPPPLRRFWPKQTINPSRKACPKPRGCPKGRVLPQFIEKCPVSPTFWRTGSRPTESLDRPRSRGFDDRRIVEQGIGMNKSISFLLGTFGYSGGSMILYGFMDRLCERGYKVYAISPQEVSRV